MEQSYMLCVLRPLEGNVKKGWVKSPKIEARDSGRLHALLEIKSSLLPYLSRGFLGTMEALKPETSLGCMFHG